jgi:hypothetical protein
VVVESSALADSELGYVESAQRLLSASRDWNQRDLFTAAERAVIRNTGWPLGVVLNRDELRPKVTTEGIEARIQTKDRRSGPGEDYWFFRRDGSYFIYRAFEEDFYKPDGGSDRSGGFDRFIWFDVRIWRIAELFLHSAALYRELAVPPDEPYLLAINHSRLEGRGFWSSSSRAIYSQKYSQVAGAAWTREVTQDYIVANLHGLVRDVSDGLFVLFDLAEIEESIINEIVDEFLSRGR